MPYHHLSGAKIGFFTIESKQINDYLLKSGEKNTKLLPNRMFLDFFYPRFLALFHKKLYLCKVK